MVTVCAGVTVAKPVAGLINTTEVLAVVACEPSDKSSLLWMFNGNSHSVGLSNELSSLARGEFHCTSLSLWRCLSNLSITSVNVYEIGVDVVKPHIWIKGQNSGSRIWYVYTP